MQYGRSILQYTLVHINRIQNSCQIPNVNILILYDSFGHDWKHHFSIKPHTKARDY